MTYDLSDYVDVAERAAAFFDKFPNGSLRCEASRLDDGWLCVARAYRTPDDPQPGEGHAFQAVPGTTPYTRHSELENCETSAWGRAMIAVGIPSKRIATSNDIRRVHETAPADAPAEPAKPKAEKPKPKPKPKPEPKTEPKPEKSQFHVPASVGDIPPNRPVLVDEFLNKRNYEVQRMRVTTFVKEALPAFKSGNTGGRDWTLHLVKIVVENGDVLELTTFDDKLILAAEQLTDTTAIVEFDQWKVGDYWKRTLHRIEAGDYSDALEAIRAAAEQQGVPAGVDATDDDIPF